MRYDVIIGADMRFSGGTSGAVAHEARALSGAGLRVGLLPLASRIFPESTPANEQISHALGAGWATLVDDPAASAELIVVHNPTVLARGLHATPIVPKTKCCVVVAHHLPVNGRGVASYNLRLVERRARALFGCDVVWAPNSQVCRESFVRNRLRVRLLKEDWTNVVYVDDWGEPRSGPRHAVLTIGRHSRSEPAKWPDSVSETLVVYPDRADVRVVLMGPDDDFLQCYRPLPRSWKVLPFGALDVREFLELIDFFVYYHSTSITESFGRTIAEAISAGVVCILPPYLEQTFGPAALYAKPEEAFAIAQRLHKDTAAYSRQSRHGREHLLQRYGPDSHVRMVKSVLADLGSAEPFRFAVDADRWTIDAEAHRLAIAARTLVNSVMQSCNRVRRRITRVSSASGFVQ